MSYSSRLLPVFVTALSPVHALQLLGLSEGYAFCFRLPARFFSTRSYIGRSCAAVLENQSQVGQKTGDFTMHETTDLAAVCLLIRFIGIFSTGREKQSKFNKKNMVPRVLMKDLILRDLESLSKETKE